MPVALRSGQQTRTARGGLQPELENAESELEQVLGLNSERILRVDCNVRVSPRAGSKGEDVEACAKRCAFESL